LLNPDLQVTELYNGQVRLEFNPKTHRYTIYDGDTVVKAPSVTTINGVLDKSGPLMYWAINQTVNYIRGALQTDGQYLDGYSATYLDTVLEGSKRAAREKKQQAADIGTLAHNWLEAYFLWRAGNGGELPPEPDNEQAVNCIQAALSWLEKHKVEIISVEQRIYSRKYKFSGTSDMFAFVDGKKTCLDWKSSKGLYPEFRFQTAAYVKAYEEEHPTERIQQRILVQLGKETGEFHAITLPRSDNTKDWRAFKGLLDAYSRLQELK
jgi:hypothetical protein